MAALPRDSLVARMLSRGTLPAWNLLEKVSKGSSWSEPAGAGKASASAASTSVGSASSTCSKKTTASSSSATSVAAVGSTVVALAKKIRQSLGNVSRQVKQALKSPQPTHRKVGKQRPSHLAVKPKPRHRKTGKQRPSHLAPAAVMQLPRPFLPETASATASPRKSGERKVLPSSTPKKRSPDRASGHLPLRSTMAPERASAPAIPAPKKPSKKVMKQKEPITKRMKLTATKREEDNYEISDLEEDEDGNRIEPDRQCKRVPSWCTNYSTLATSQDPDSIFGSRMPLCDLDSIFPDRLYRSLHPGQPRQRKRGSSCHWFRDALTPHEIHAYTVKMGQSRAWSTVRASMPGIAHGNRPGKDAPKDKVVALVKPHVAN